MYPADKWTVPEDLLPCLGVRFHLLYGYTWICARNLAGSSLSGPEWTATDSPLTSFESILLSSLP